MNTVKQHAARPWHRAFSSFPFLSLLSALLGPSPAAAQNPYRVAGDHYHLIFDNPWVRATRVTYAPGEKAPIHDHPKGGALIYVYLTDAGVMRFRHYSGDLAGHANDRPPVKAGSIRLAPATEETHSVEYLGDVPSEYITLELGTALAGPGARLPPVVLDPRQSKNEVQFEDNHVRVVRVSCAPGGNCPESGHPKDPAIVVVLAGAQKGQVKWSPGSLKGPMQQVRFELKDPLVRAGAEPK